MHAFAVNCDQEQKIWESSARWLGRAKLNRHTGVIFSYWQKDLANSVQSLSPTTITLDKIPSSYTTVLPICRLAHKKLKTHTRYLFKKSLSNMGFLFEIVSVSFKALCSKSLLFSSWKTARVLIWLHCAVKTRAWQRQKLPIHSFYFLKLEKYSLEVSDQRRFIRSLTFFFAWHYPF